MPTTPYPHTHFAGKFRTLKTPFVTDDGDFTHKCLNCGESAGLEYEDICEAGCDVWVTECMTCNVFREILMKE